jgi:hypothetical protein
MPERARNQGRTEADRLPEHRSPAEVREYEARVWDLTRHLVHPAFLYVVLLIALWCALGRNPAFSGGALSFWKRTAIHGVEFLAAWGVFYGTLLRDMRMRTRTVTVVLWIAAAGVAAAWAWPNAASLEAAPALWTILLIELAVGFAGWVITMATWLRAKSRHAEPSSGGDRV